MVYLVGSEPTWGRRLTRPIWGESTFWHQSDKRESKTTLGLLSTSARFQHSCFLFTYKQQHEKDWKILHYRLDILRMRLLSNFNSKFQTQIWNSRSLGKATLLAQQLKKSGNFKFQTQNVMLKSSKIFILKISYLYQHVVLGAPFQCYSYLLLIIFNQDTMYNIVQNHISDRIASN